MTDTVDIANLLDHDAVEGSKELEKLALTVDIIRLRSEGKSHAEVARILRISPDAVAAHIKTAMRTILTENGAEEVRAIELAKMERMAQRVAPYVDAQAGAGKTTTIVTKSGIPVEVAVNDLPPNPQLIDAALKVSKARRDMTGADSATKVTINLDGGEHGQMLNDRLSRLERLQDLTDHIARNGIGSGRVNDDEIVDAEVISDDSDEN